jgi:hypothetical protein
MRRAKKLWINSRLGDGARDTNRDTVYTKGEEAPV